MHEAVNWSAMLDGLADMLAETGGEGWLVGGCLRDALLGVPVRDVDIAITGEPLPVAERLAQRLRLAVARLGHGTIRLVARHNPENYLDVTRLQGGDILADLVHRDFTVNAMALPLDARAEWLALVREDGEGMPSLIDPFDGRRDLHMRRLVAVGSETFRDDPGRIVRAARLRARFGLLPDVETTQWAQAAIPLLQALSPDRQREEMALLLALSQATDGVVLLADWGALPVLYPGLSGDSATHALETLRELDRLMGIRVDGVNFPAFEMWSQSDTRRVSLRLTGLVHARVENDGESSAPTLVRQTKAVLETDGDVERLHAARMLFWKGGKKADLTADALVVAAASALTGDDQRRGIEVAMRANALVETYIHRREHLIPPALLSGKDLMLALGIPSGPMLGRLLRAVRVAQLADEVSNRVEALELARHLQQAHPTDFSTESK
jgi:tRNA nucleotidyltransferase/poly(A) polymerase